MSADDRRRANLTAALGFLRLPPTEPELQLLHRWLDTWTGVGLITAGVERHGMRLSLSHIADGEWRATFNGERQLGAARLRCRADAVGRGSAGGVGGGEQVRRTSCGSSCLELVALILSAASLLVAAAAFYRVEMRGPIISIRPPLEHRQQLRWDGQDPPEQQTIEVQLLVINDRPRAGMLEAFKVTARTFLPHQPRGARRRADSRQHAGAAAASSLPRPP